MEESDRGDEEPLISPFIPWAILMLNFLVTLTLAFPFYTSYVALPQMMVSMRANPPRRYNGCSRRAAHAMAAGQDHYGHPFERMYALNEVQTILQRAGEASDAFGVSAQDIFRQHLMQEASVAAAQDCFFLMAIVFIVAMFPVLFVRPNGERSGENKSECTSESAWMICNHRSHQEERIAIGASAQQRRQRRWKSMLEPCQGLVKAR